MSPKKALQLLMAALKHNGSTATFFVTGKYYEKNPQLVADFAEQGFEVGYHGHTHIKLKSKDIFDKELEQSARFLDNLHPIGFRAPWIYLPEDCMEQLPNYGFQYDSSTFGPVGSRFQRNGLEIFPVTSLNYFGTVNGVIYPKTAGLGMLRREFPIGSGIFVSWMRHG